MRYPAVTMGTAAPLPRTAGSPASRARASLARPTGAQPPPGRTREPRGPGWYGRPRWLAVLAVLVLAAAGLGTWAGLSGSGAHGAASVMSSMSAKPKPKKPTQSELMKALVVTNQSADAAGKLPPSTCKQDNSTEVTCTAPVVGISGVVFQTYPNLTALYAAYMAKVASLNSGQFKANFNDCESEDTYGEVAWNHLFQHPRIYTVDQMTNSGFTDDKAAGRVFCNYTQGLSTWSGPRTTAMSWASWPARCTETCGTGGWRSTTTSAWAVPP